MDKIDPIEAMDEISASVATHRMVPMTKLNIQLNQICASAPRCSRPAPSDFPGMNWKVSPEASLNAVSTRITGEKFLCCFVALSFNSWQFIKSILTFWLLSCFLLLNRWWVDELTAVDCWQVRLGASLCEVVKLTSLRRHAVERYRTGVTALTALTAQSSMVHATTRLLPMPGEWPWRAINHPNDTRGNSEREKNTLQILSQLQLRSGWPDRLETWARWNNAGIRSQSKLRKEPSPHRHLRQMNVANEIWNDMKLTNKEYCWMRVSLSICDSSLACLHDPTQPWPRLAFAVGKTIRGDCGLKAKS